MKLSGTIIKMEVKFSNPVQYKLPIGDERLSMNDLIGEYIVLKYTGDIFVLAVAEKLENLFLKGSATPVF